MRKNCLGRTGKCLGDIRLFLWRSSSVYAPHFPAEGAQDVAIAAPLVDGEELNKMAVDKQRGKCYLCALNGVLSKLQLGGIDLPLLTQTQLTLIGFPLTPFIHVDCNQANWPFKRAQRWHLSNLASITSTIVMSFELNIVFENDSQLYNNWIA